MTTLPTDRKDRKDRAILDRLADFPEHVPREQGAPKALEGIRVVDFTHFIAGPFATMILADMGADVIKIEAPLHGDEFRYYPPRHPDNETLGGPYLWANRNKRSIVLDLRREAGREALRRLIPGADAFVHSMRPNAVKRLGFDYPSVRAIWPDIVYCAGQGFGSGGRYRDKAASDDVMQAGSGMAAK